MGCGGQQQVRELRQAVGGQPVEGEVRNRLQQGDPRFPIRILANTDDEDAEDALERNNFLESDGPAKS